MTIVKLYSAKEPSTSFRRKRGLYCLLTGLTVIFIIFYATPTNLELTAIARKWHTMESLWRQTDSPEALQFAKETKRNETTLVKQSFEISQSESDSVAGGFSSVKNSVTTRSTQLDISSILTSDETQIEHATATTERAKTFLNTAPPEYDDPILKQQPEISKNNVISQNERNKYLLDSKSCKIPDYDPFHPSVQKFIEYMEPVDCSDYPPITYNEGNELRLNYTLAHSKGYENFTCCYRALYRDKEGETDDSYRLDEKCNTMNEITYITDEFLKVECKGNNETNIYENYHSFIIEKPNVEERCNDSSNKYSILLLGVDNMSRLNMHRQLNKTFAYLQALGAIEMYGFNKVGYNTFPNVIPTLSGYDESELPKVCWNSGRKPIDKCDFIWKAFAKKGYRTLLAEDTPDMATFNYGKVGFFNQPTDYYLRPFILAYQIALGRRNQYFCDVCVGSVSETEAVLHWTQEFALKFKNKPYFAFSWINSLTHGSLNTGSSSDHMYANFFETLYNSRALKNTIVIFLSDHGMRWGHIRTTPVGRMEERLPMLLFLLPTGFRQGHPTEIRNLIENSHRLITPFDIHATLDHLLHIDEEWRTVDTSNVPSELKAVFRERAQSLLMPISQERSCKDAHISVHWCPCGSFIPADPDSRSLQEIAFFLVYAINKLIKPDLFKSTPCKQLELLSIKRSRMLPVPVGNHAGKYVTKSIYTVVIQTTPGGGLFKGTIQFNDDDNMKLLGYISRLNLYRSAPACHKDASSEIYCHCS